MAINLEAKIEVLNAEYLNKCQEFNVLQALCTAQRDLITIQKETIEMLEKRIEELKEVNSKAVSLLEEVLKRK